jgi:hypothetical protein
VRSFPPRIRLSRNVLCPTLAQTKIPGLATPHSASRVDPEALEALLAHYLGLHKEWQDPDR